MNDNVIRFPIKYKSDGGAADAHRQQLIALRMVLDDINSGQVNPKKLFIMYGCVEAEWTWSYINLGLSPEALDKAIAVITKDMLENPGDQRDPD